MSTSWGIGVGLVDSGMRGVLSLVGVRKPARPVMATSACRRAIRARGKGERDIAHRDFFDGPTVAVGSAWCSITATTGARVGDVCQEISESSATTRPVSVTTYRNGHVR